MLFLFLLLLLLFLSLRHPHPPPAYLPSPSCCFFILLLFFCSFCLFVCFHTGRTLPKQLGNRELMKHTADPCKWTGCLPASSITEHLKTFQTWLQRVKAGRSNPSTVPETRSHLSRSFMGKNMSYVYVYHRTEVCVLPLISMANGQGTLGHSRLRSLSRYGLYLAYRVEVVCVS